MKRANMKFTVLSIALFFVSTIFVFGPSTVYLTNPMEFSFRYSEFLWYALPIAFILLVLVFLSLQAISSVFPTSREKIMAIAFAISFLFWLQGNILAWDYGLLNGKDIDWNAKISYVLIELFLWIPLVFFAIIKSSFFLRIASMASILLVVGQLITTSVYAGRQPETPSFKTYTFDETNKFNFSKEKNVIVVILDTFQSDLFQEIIDEDRAYRDIFDGFVYFRNALSGFPTTYPSVPLILTAQYYENDIPIQTFIKNAYLSSSSLPKVLKENQFQVDLFPTVKQTVYFDNQVLSNMKGKNNGVKEKQDIAFLYDISLFRHTPHIIKKRIYNNQKWFFKRMVIRMVGGKENSVRQSRALAFLSKQALEQSSDIQFLSSLASQSSTLSETPTFKFYHLNGPHDPYRLNERLEYQEMKNERKGFKEQSKASLKIMKLFFDQLKELGIYDNSMIILVGDHGSGEFPPKNTTASSYPISSGIPLMLIKKFNTKEKFQISNAPVSLADIPKTVLSELSIPQNLPGHSVFLVKERDTRPRKFYYYKWVHHAWAEEYLPTMKEFQVEGFSWDIHSWKETGVIMKPHG